MDKSPPIQTMTIISADPLRRQRPCWNEATPHSRPYMAALLNYRNKTICGGFLVGCQWVMTSARCKISGFNTVVVLGAHDLWANESAQEHYLVEQAYQHENYMFQNNTFSNDILLLKLLSKVRLSKNIQPLPLPTSSRDLSEGTLCSVAGWSPYQDDCKFMLYEANASIYDRSKCQKFYPKIDYGKICAGNREDDSQLFIQGEMGDPLVCNGVAHGILSYRNPCPPAVYTHIAEYIPWIEETMAK
ncbi:mast cell protease 2-like [Zootoca vivipara]|uniref:mast cell protease 2-like n=1 Tax=Zootoca vivipara TaxID=8524 RepID=UPI00293C0F3F|nr:mast cell protease 2-like [Zootoca vivipara]